MMLNVAGSSMFLTTLSGSAFPPASTQSQLFHSIISFFLYFRRQNSSSSVDSTRAKLVTLFERETDRQRYWWTFPARVDPGSPVSSSASSPRRPPPW
jgi:hypothetical protein